MHSDDRPRRGRVLRLAGRLRGLGADHHLSLAGIFVACSWGLVGVLIVVDTVLRWLWQTAMLVWSLW